MHHSGLLPYLQTAQALSMCPPTEADWLRTPGSMTQRLLQASEGTLKVILLRQGWSTAFPEECVQLGLVPRTRVLLRETLLSGYGVPWIFARSIFPQKLFTEGDRWLIHALDHTPIGHLLYRHPHMHRSPLQFARLDARHSDYQRARLFVQNLPESLWARRSCFYLHHKPLLVSEVLLPALGKKSCDNP